MNAVLNVNDFDIKELENIEAPMSDEQKAGIAVGIAVGLDLIAIGAVAAC